LTRKVKSSIRIRIATISHNNARFFYLLKLLLLLLLLLLLP
jgi:hypothetical protein